MFEVPRKNVSLSPYPKSGKIRFQLNKSMTDKKVTTMPIAVKGAIKAVVLLTEADPLRLARQAATKKKRMSKRISLLSG